MRASVRMTRYLESWGAARPFAHLSHRDSVSSDCSGSQGRRRKVGLQQGLAAKDYLQTAPVPALWNSKSGVTLVAECLLSPWVFSAHAELGGCLCSTSFCQNITIFTLPISLPYYNRGISSKQNYLFFLLCFHLEILPGSSFHQNLTIFRLPISLPHLKHNISSKQSYLIFLLVFHLEILPGFEKKKKKIDALNT